MHAGMSYQTGFKHLKYGWTFVDVYPHLDCQHSEVIAHGVLSYGHTTSL